MRRVPRFFSAVAVVAVAGAVALGAGPAQAGLQKPPKLVQLSYDEEPGAQGYDDNLGAYIKRADEVLFVAGYENRQSRIKGKYKSSVTDTDIDDPEAQHPWVPDSRKGGRELVKLVRESLHETGKARVRITATNETDETKTVVVIDLDDDCTQDPPLYPVSCEAKP